MVVDSRKKDESQIAVTLSYREIDDDDLMMSLLEGNTVMVFSA